MSLLKNQNPLLHEKKSPSLGKKYFEPNTLQYFTHLSSWVSHSTSLQLISFIPLAVLSEGSIWYYTKWHLYLPPCVDDCLHMLHSILLQPVLGPVQNLNA